MLTLGIDIGSSATKAVMLRDGKTIVSEAVIPVGTGTSGAQRTVEAIEKNSGFSLEDMAFIVATGYGRTQFKPAQKQISELTCHAKGVFFLNPAARTIIDIGGQDLKVIKVDERGTLLNFVMNDKCAAGTGRFLEVMARVLEVDVSDLGNLSERSKLFLDISSTCTVFAESEVISYLASGALPQDVAAGIHRSVAKIACGLVNRVGALQPDVVMTGGVAQNAGVLRAIQERLDLPIVIPEMPQLTGALGAALLAYQYAEG